MMRLRQLLVLLAAGLLPGVACAQTAAPQQGQNAPSVQPRGLTVAPDGPKQQPEAVRSSAAGEQRVESTGRPADICQELVAYLQQAAQQPGGTGQVQTQAGAAPPAPQAQPQNANAAGAAGPMPPPAAGQTAPTVDRPQQSSGLSAPTPTAPQAPAPNVTMSEAQAWLSTKDFRACQQG